MELIYKNFFVSFGLFVLFFLLVNCSVNETSKIEISKTHHTHKEEVEEPKTETKEIVKKEEKKSKLKSPPIIVFAVISSKIKLKAHYIQFKERRFFSQLSCEGYVENNYNWLLKTIDIHINQNYEDYEFLHVSCADIANFETGNTEKTYSGKLT